MNKQSVFINFGKGLDTKTDPWQLQVGSFLSLENTVFDKGGLLQKRNGYDKISVLNPVSSYLTTLNNNLISIGDSVSAYSSSTNQWITKGTLQPCSLNTLPLIRNNLNQVQNDTAILNGLVCTVYTQTNNTTSATITSYMYAIADAVTGQNIVEPTLIPALSGGVISGSSRVFVLNNLFIIVSQVIVSGTTYLQYFYIPSLSPVISGTNTPNSSTPKEVCSISYAPLSSNPGWDGVSCPDNNCLMFAYNTTSGGQGVEVVCLTQGQISANQTSSITFKFSSTDYVANLMSVSVDLIIQPNIFYICFSNTSETTLFVGAVDLSGGIIYQKFAPNASGMTGTPINIASAVSNDVCSVFVENYNYYSYDSSIQYSFIQVTTIDSTGTYGSVFNSINGLGLASKAFVINETVYYLATYQSTYQPTYFLINGSLSTSLSPVITAKLAYENGGGFVTLGLPSVTITDNVAQLSYLYKDLVESLNTLNNTTQTTAGGIYSQTGINLCSFTIGTSSIDSATIANNVHISGGYLSMFDGYLPVEHNFFLWPDYVEATYTEVSTVTPTGTTTSGSNIITSVSSVTGVYPGMTITGTGIPSGATIVLVGSTTITISVSATGSHTSETLTIQGNIAAVPTGGVEGGQNYAYMVTYEWSDNNGLIYRSAPSIPVFVTTAGTGTTGSVTIHVPTLRVTQKTANPVKIVIYRWSENTQVYNQVTSISSPLLNNTNINSVSFVDTLPDSQVVGNNIIYTTGGVVEDVNASATDIMTLFDTRLWIVDSEDRNLLWVSKQVVENTPVEMSDLFTIYIAPNTGTVASTGPITALAPMDDKLIIFKENAIYYINGVGPNDLGTTSTGCSLGNYSNAIFITSVVGCNNQQSIVLTQDGLMFQSDKGIWLLGRGLQTSYIGAPVQQYNQSIVNSANVIPETNYVIFTLDTGEMLMYDYYYQQWGTFNGASALSSCIYNGLHTIVNSYGDILQETPGKYLDGSNPVLMSFSTSWMNIASLQGYERFYDFYLLGKYLSPHFLQCQIAYDYNDSIVHQVLVQPKNFSQSTPGPFGIPTPFGSPGNKEQSRIHAKQQLCESFKLTITEVFNPAYGTVAGAGFTMSGITLNLGIKKSTRPISETNQYGLS